MKYRFGFILFLSVFSFANAKDLLQEEDILITQDTILVAECIAHQSFSTIGPPERNYYSHEIVYGYFYDDKKCNAAHANAILYKKIKTGFKKIWDYGGADPATHVYFLIHQHDGFLILIADHNDGGNAGYSYRQAYVIDDNDELHGIGIQSIESWVSSQLRKGQYVHSVGGGIHYSTYPITFNERIFNKGDHYRRPTGGTLKANLQLVKENSDYKIKILSKENTDNAYRFNDKGLEYYQKKQYKEALHWFKKSTNVSPNYWQAWNNQAITLYKLGDYKSSIEISTFVFNNKQSTPAAKGNASFNVAKAYEKLGELKQSPEYLASSREWYEMAYSIEPNKAREKAVREITIKIKSKGFDSIEK